MPAFTVRVDRESAATNIESVRFLKFSWHTDRPLYTESAARKITGYTSPAGKRTIYPRQPHSPTPACPRPQSTILPHVTVPHINILDARAHAPRAVFHSSLPCPRSEHTTTIIITIAAAAAAVVVVVVVVVVFAAAAPFFHLCLPFSARVRSCPQRRPRPALEMQARAT